jgi:hypothetical protein
VHDLVERACRSGEIELMQPIAGPDQDPHADPG